MTANITYRLGAGSTAPSTTTYKNAPLNNTEIDGNFLSLTTDIDQKASLASPALTGTPTAPTAAAATNTTQLATTAFVLTNSVLKTTAATAGTFDTSATTPTGTIRLNYGGYFYPTLLNLVGTADTATAATHYFVETDSDGYVRPKTLASVKTEVVTTAAVNAAAATAVGIVTSGSWNANTIAIAKGGTGATTAQLAINALAAATTSGQYLRGNGTNVVMSTIQAADVPTLNQNTTGTATTATNLSGGTASTSTLASSGYGLWGTTPITYGMLMSSSPDVTYGGRMGAITSTAPEATTVAAADSTSDYNTYFTMSGGTNRGFVFRNSFASKLFSINGDAVRSTVAMAAPSFNGITVASSNAATSLASSASAGTATSVSRSDHVHPYPTPNAIGTYNKTEIDQLVTGLDAKASVKAATTANITLSAPQSIDGVSLVAGDRVLVKNQTNTIQNGIYLVAAGAWTRTTDADGSGELKAGTYVLVTSGTTQANTGWIVNTAGPVLPGTDAMTWTQFNGLGHIEAGTALSKTGNVISAGTSGTASASTYLRGDGAWSSLHIGTTTVQNTSAAQALTGITSVTSGTTLALNSTGANAISLDSTTTGAINIGTNANAKTVTIGNTSGASGVVVNSGTAGVTFNQIATSVFKVAATAAPTTDMVQFTNAGFANVTAGVNAVNITYVGGAAAVEASAQRIDITPGTTSGGIWSALRVVPTTVPVAGVTLNGVKFENITTGAGTENMIYAGTGWDQILSYAGTSIVSGTGLVNAARLTGSVPSASLTTSINIGTTSIALNRASAEQALTGITGISTTSTTALTLDSGTTGAVNIGTNANAKTVTVGNVTTTTGVIINAGSGGIKLPTVGTSGLVRLGAAGILSADTTAYLSGTVPIGNGGTNITTYAAGDILYASAINVLSKLAKGTDGQVLKLAAGLPAWGTDVNTTYSASTGLTLTGTAFSVNYGSTSTTACIGDDARLSDARVASDVYAWAKAATKPTYTGSEITQSASYRFVTDTEKTTWNAAQPASTAITTSNIASQSVNYATTAGTANALNTGNSYSGVNFTSSGRYFAANGSAAAPSIAFSSDGSQDTGFYWISDGVIGFATNATYSGQIAAGGNLTMVGNVTAYSDARLKTNIEKITGALDKVDQLNGYTFDRTDINTSRQTGVIAQEVMKVLPEAVLGTEETTYAVAYGNMVGLLIEAIKELRAEVAELKGMK